MTSLAPDVVAVLVAPSEAEALVPSALEQALGGSRRPGGVLVASYDGRARESGRAPLDRLPPRVSLLAREATRSAAVRSGVEAAAERSAWVWLLDIAVEPGPSTLEELLEAREPEDPLPPASVLSSKVVDADGSDVVMPEVRPALQDMELMAAAAQRRLLPLRMAGSPSLLLSGEAVQAYGPPLVGDERWRPEPEFTARILRRRAGFQVPASTVRALEPGNELDPATRLRNGIWTLRGTGWSRSEKLVLGGKLLLDSAANARRTGVGGRGILDLGLGLWWALSGRPHAT